MYLQARSQKNDGRFGFRRIPLLLAYFYALYAFIRGTDSFRGFEPGKLPKCMYAHVFTCRPIYWRLPADKSTSKPELYHQDRGA